MNSNDENKSNVNETTKNLRGLTVKLRDGSREKKKLSNNLSITSDAANIVITLREAKALRNFLNENLD